MESPVLYVLAGPNGIGKTTSSYDIIPENIPIINSDEIAKQVRAVEIVKVTLRNIATGKHSDWYRNNWTTELHLPLKRISPMRKHGSFNWCAKLRL